jgi:hypothetical protein
MAYSRRVSYALFAVVLVLLCTGTLSSAQSGGEAKKPSLSLRVTPPLGFSPLRVRLVVDVRGGTDDYEEFYCPTVQWDWGDGTGSESGEDCDLPRARASFADGSTEHIPTSRARSRAV